MKKLFVLLMTLASVAVYAQSKTTQELDEKYDGLSLYFYKNTLRMLNQSDSKEFDELIKDIEKMRFMMIDKKESVFGDNELKKLKAGYKTEAYEDVMSGRMEGRTFQVLLKTKGDEVLGTVILAGDSTSLMVLDILGTISLTKIPEFFKTLDESTDIGGKIKDFTRGGEDRVEEKKKRSNH